MKFRLRRFNVSLFFLIILLYLEIVFRLLTNIKIFNISILYVIIFSALFSLIIKVICSTRNEVVNKVIFLSSVFITTLIYIIEFCVFKMFSFYFDWSLLGATSQVASFADDGISLITKNIIGIILLLLPFIILVIKNKYIKIKQNSIKEILINISVIILVWLLFIFSLNINKNSINSSYKLYYKVNNIDLNIKRFGVLNSFLIDTKRALFGFEEEFIPIDNDNTNIDNIVTNDKYNILDIDFDKLINNEKNETIKNMHKYFSSELGTKQNEYTGYFKGKNLILFMAESFNEIAVREDLTPTLYKLVNNGFVFDNFYTPTISSTIGGEFQELTGLVASSGFLAPWKKGENLYPFGIGKVFKEMNYVTHAYHNHNYTFQNRNKYLAGLGFDNFKGCRNGLEKDINCKIWPESDVEMIQATINDYINSDEPFFTYYVTVSGHGDYGWSRSAMAKKHKSEVSHLDYSEKPLAYLAAQIELDKALELLIDKLEEAGKLDDTVIALVGDHYPYYLSLNEVNEISSYKKDGVVEINRSNFILWNNKMDTKHITKVGSQIDVLPTIYNLFEVSFDSRLIIGKDILSDTEGLAIFGNRSWVSDKGTYFAGKNQFVPKEGIEVTEDYIARMNNIVTSKAAMSKNIMTQDYYRKVFGE